MPRHRITLLGGRLAAIRWKRVLRRGIVVAVLGILAAIGVFAILATGAFMFIALLALMGSGELPVPSRASAACHPAN